MHKTYEIFHDLGLTKACVMVEWSDLDEGLNGDYDPTDPDDVPLLRFDVSRFETSFGWEGVDDASYCTRIPIDTDELTLLKLLKVIMDEVFEPVSKGESIKKICERLSWIDEEGNY